MRELGERSMVAAGKSAAALLLKITPPPSTSMFVLRPSVWNPNAKALCGTPMDAQIWQMSEHVWAD